MLPQNKPESLNSFCSKTRNLKQLPAEARGGTPSHPGISPWLRGSRFGVCIYCLSILHCASTIPQLVWCGCHLYYVPAILPLRHAGTEVAVLSRPHAKQLAALCRRVAWTFFFQLHSLKVLALSRWPSTRPVPDSKSGTQALSHQP